MLRRATTEDRMKAVEPTGEPTDVYKLMASKTFGVPYDRVTDHQRRAIKSATALLRYR